MADSAFDDLPGGDIEIAGRSIYIYGIAIGAVAIIYLWWSGRNVPQSGLNVVGVPDVRGDLGDLPKAAEFVPSDFYEDEPEPTNREWMVKAITYLVTQGINPLSAQVAIQKYFDGEQLDYTQTNYINQAVAKYGPPPQGLYGPPLITEKPPATGGGGTTPVAPAEGFARVPYVARFVAIDLAPYYKSPVTRPEAGRIKAGQTITTTWKATVSGQLWYGTIGNRWFLASHFKTRK